MKIGILDCDYLNPKLQARFGKQYSEMFIKRFKAIDSSLQFKTYSAIDSVLPTDLSECDVWLITGSKFDAYGDDIDWVLALREWIVRAVEAKVKLIGICFGHQVIAKALGAKVGKSDKGWGAGLMRYPVAEQLPWMQPQLNSIGLIASHQDQVFNLPEGAKNLAGGAFCPHYMYQIGKHVLCIQGHPEFDVEYDLAILNLRKEQLGHSTYTLAVASLIGSQNGDEVLRWILAFSQS